MEAAIIAFAAAALIFAAFQTWALRQASRDIREIATEAILASRSNSAEELMHASAHSHLLKLEREQGLVQRPAAEKTEQPRDPNKIMLDDGTLLDVLRPFG